MFDFAAIIFLAVIVVNEAFALPSNSSHLHTLYKRDKPRIGNDRFTNLEIRQISDGISDVFVLAHTAVNNFKPEVFQKYFRMEDKDTVEAVFSSILGGRDSHLGNQLLGDITIRQDYRLANGEFACEPDFLGVLDDWGTNQPQLILCDLVYEYGAIGRGYGPGAPAVKCENLGEKTSYNMYVFGGTLLHEYTHWPRLISPTLGEGGATVDLDPGYGPYNCQNVVDKQEARRNADSYVWFALENYWTVKCGRAFETPTEEEDIQEAPVGCEGSDENDGGDGDNESDGNHGEH